MTIIICGVKFGSNSFNMKKIKVTYFEATFWLKEKTEGGILSLTTDSDEASKWTEEKIGGVLNRAQQTWKASASYKFELE